MATSAFNGHSKATNSMIDLLCKAAGIDSNPVRKITCVAEAGGIVEFVVERIGETEKVLSALSPLVAVDADKCICDWEPPHHVDDPVCPIHGQQKSSP